MMYFSFSLSVPNRLFLLLLFAGGLVSPLIAAEHDALGPIPPGVMDPIREPAVRRPPAPARPLPQRGQQTAGRQAREIQYHQAEAEAHNRAGRWRSALMEYQTLMRLEPDNHLHTLRAAILATMVQQYALADRYFSRLEGQVDSLSPDHAVAWAGALLYLREYDRARALLDTALDQQPNHLRGRYIQLLLDQLQQRPLMPEVWRSRTLADQVIVLGWIDKDQILLGDRVGEAGLAMILAVTIGEIRSAHMQRVYDSLRDAAIAMQRQDWESALQHLDEAVAKGADQPYLQLEIARCELYLGRGDEAVARVDNVLQRDGEITDLIYPAAYVWIGAEAYDRAVPLLQAALETEPDEGMRMHMALAYALAGSGQLDAAWPMIETMKEQFPAEFPEWMERDTAHIRAIRADPRFPDLMGGE